MQRMAIGVSLMLALVACKGDKSGPDTGNVDDTSAPADDTGTPADDTGEVTSCAVVLLEASPDDGDDGWYYRDPLSLTFSEPAESHSPVITLTDSDGAEVATTVTWADGSYQATITPSDLLAGSADYALHVEVCEYSGDLTFSTDVYGGALEEDSSGMVGNTYVFDMSKADITQPEGLGYLLATYLTEPLLIGIEAADESEIDLVGAQGKLRNDGTYRQYGEDVWDFPVADFTTAPYFSADTDRIEISYSGYAIPIEDFHLEGTFSPDATSVGGGLAYGLGDTRYMGPLMGRGDEPDAVCSLIADFQIGIECVECEDGGPYCLFLEAEFGKAPLEEGLTIEIPTD